MSERASLTTAVGSKKCSWQPPTQNFYSAINTVGIAPCVVGKSNMFRKSHLERLTDPAQNPLLSPANAARRRGVDYFSSYICENRLIGGLIFKSNISGYKKHGLVRGEVAIQPISGMTVAAYIARRVRWLRVRKWENLNGHACGTRHDATESQGGQVSEIEVTGGVGRISKSRAGWARFEVTSEVREIRSHKRVNEISAPNNPINPIQA
ncbi:Ceramide glucosyltransferase [Podospora pseudocomata]|uniref:Ceramide glucosyltransferase n=1 Tax=Podospora pseudocomata TaxID=2093779 RepID=A0ABR0GA47_9PEZI|nr:Ceramide glucosyltransferase [Podospora pseudocomata]